MNQQQLLEQYGLRESMEYDVVIVGGGPTGLATTIRIKQPAAETGKDVSVVVLEKGSEPGAHTLLSAVMDPRAITELPPNWKADGAPFNQPVTDDDVLFLSKTDAKYTPDQLVPRSFHNDGCYVISLSNVVKRMATQAEALGVEIFPGFVAAEVSCDDKGTVRDVVTGNMGIGKDGEPTENLQLGTELPGKYTIFAEGARGHLGRQLLEKFKLNAGKDPQTFVIGIKKFWEIDPAKARPGLVVHTVGWPVEDDTFDGGFLYHSEDNKIMLGFVIGLDYKNLWMSPFEEMQRWKAHPAIRMHIESGKRIGYDARATSNGTSQTLPKTVFLGGVLVGCDTGYLSATRIKGSHAVIKSGMLRSDAVFEAVMVDRSVDELTAYPTAFEQSWLKEELNQLRNFKLWFKKSPTLGETMIGIEQWLPPKIGVSNSPWTLHGMGSDNQSFKPASECPKTEHLKSDGKITLDRPSLVLISNTNHEENQPAHLTLKDPTVPARINLTQFTGPEQRYCPIGVYEFVRNDENTERLQINAQNCVHCKTCDIKDPTQNIVRVTPEGGGGPNYVGT